MNCSEALEAEEHLILEVDHPARHAKYIDDDPQDNVNTEYESKQKVTRDPMMTEGCLPPREAKIYLSKGTWSTFFIEGLGTRMVQMKLKFARRKLVSSAPGDPPSSTISWPHLRIL